MATLLKTRPLQGVVGGGIVVYVMPLQPSVLSVVHVSDVLCTTSARLLQVFMSCVFIYQMQKRMRGTGKRLYWLLQMVAAH